MVRRSTVGISVRILLYEYSMAYHDVIHILTSGIALYMHFTTAYAASRASVVPAIATDTRHCYCNASVKRLPCHRGIGIDCHTLNINFMLGFSSARLIVGSVCSLRDPNDADQVPACSLRGVVSMKRNETRGTRNDFHEHCYAISVPVYNYWHRF